MGTPRTVAAALTASLAIALALACGRALPPSPHLGPGAGGARPEAAHRANEGCTTCHEAIAQEWRASNHAEAFRHGTFQLAYIMEPLPFCAACHAPEADPARPLPPASDLGVACVTCHPGGRRWRLAGSAAAPATPRERANAACASCHEFPFPGDGAGAPPRLMQKTVSEHAASSARDTPCVGCHMRAVEEPGGGRHVDHRFLASRGADLVRRASRVEVRREGDAAVFTFTRASAGHALPTGDLFRRLRLVVESDAAARTVFLSRKTRESSADGREPDTRPFADGRDVYVAVIPLQDLRGPLRYRVVYERVAHPNGEDDEGATVDGAIELARGDLR